MSDNDNPFISRNPQIILEPEIIKRTCPKCGDENYTGRNVGGVVLFRCLDSTCNYTWQGGLPRVPEDPRLPKPPMDPKDKPRVMFDYDPFTKDFIEINYPVDLTQEFRKGAPIPNPGEDDE